MSVRNENVFFFERTIDELFSFKVIVRKDGRIILFCKGADSKIKERLDPSEKTIMSQTDEHLNVKKTFVLFFDLEKFEIFVEIRHRWSSNTLFSV